VGARGGRGGCVTGLHIVVPAGGSGTRLWPLSRSAHPKFLHAFIGDRTLLQATVDRLLPTSSPERVWVVTGGAHAVAVARQLPEVREDHLLVEPAPRDSAPAIALAAALIARREPRAVMGAFAADHLIGDAEAFRTVVRHAADAAAAGSLVTVGITPTAPETAYGYLRLGEPLDGGAAVRVEQFEEKPTYERAAEYLASGRYAWNAGMFVWRVDVFLGEVARQLPALAAGLERIVAAWDGPDRDEVLFETWPSLPKISVDHGVMEGAGERGLVACVPGSFGWNDLGDWHTIGQVLPLAEDGSVVVGGGDDVSDLAVSVDSPGCVVVPRSGRLVATLGISDVVVVDTPDAVLVCARDRAQDVKGLVQALNERGAGAYV
jgi:mannose-1-phosphate guanylyltransferase